jgi:hypothetical protein
MLRLSRGMSALSAMSRQVSFFGKKKSSLGKKKNAMSKILGNIEFDGNKKTGYNVKLAEPIPIPDIRAWGL